MSNIYLIGFMGVGKSTAGKRLASKLGFDFIDTDSVFEEKYKLDIDTFFSKYGEELFRKLEFDVLKSTFSFNNCVISTGGGMPCYMDAMQQINNNGMSIHLSMSVNAILARLLSSKQKRPLVKNKSKEELFNFISSKLMERNQCYSQAAITVSAISININSLVKEIELHK
jgi:shikimate kinase